MEPNAPVPTTPRETSLALQRSLLTDPPTVPGLTVVARYRPSAVDTAVGGDWYDAFSLPGGTWPWPSATSRVTTWRRPRRWDSCAACCARSRTTATGRRRVEVLARLDRVAAGLAVTDFTSALLGRLRLDTATARPPRPCCGGPTRGIRPRRWWARTAGSRSSTDARGAVLGVLPGRARPTASVTVPAGSFLLLHTDGLVERRGPEDDASIARVVAEAAGRGDGTLEGLCDELLAGAPPVDDVAVLAVCVGT